MGAACKGAAAACGVVVVVPRDAASAMQAGAARRDGRSRRGTHLHAAPICMEHMLCLQSLVVRQLAFRQETCAEENGADGQAGMYTGRRHVQGNRKEAEGKGCMTEARQTVELMNKAKIQHYNSEQAWRQAVHEL